MDMHGYIDADGRSLGNEQDGSESDGDTQPMDVVEQNRTRSTDDQMYNAPGQGTGASKGKGSGKVSRLSQITADRPIFTLSVAADLLGLHPRTLRIYEEKRLVTPARTEGNRRRYSQNDISRFQFIRRLTSGGVNLEGVRIILDMADELVRLGGDPNDIIERNLNALDLATGDLDLGSDLDS
jgi:MerR family transcriptional regulator, heat shock protein HspR